MSGTLYLIPAPMGGDTLSDILPTDVLEIAKRLTYFVVENAKTTRAHLKMFGTPHELRSLQMNELSEHTKDHEVFALLKPLLDGIDVGLMSEAGCPGVADPGARLVQLAHQRGIKVLLICSKEGGIRSTQQRREPLEGVVFLRRRHRREHERGCAGALGDRGDKLVEFRGHGEGIVGQRERYAKRFSVLTRRG